MAAVAMLLLVDGLASVALPKTMRAVRKVGFEGCRAPDFRCVAVDNVTVPAPGLGQVLIKTAGTGINPDELSILSTPLVHYTLGIDVAGTVASVGPGVTRFSVGDRVWSAGVRGGMAEFTTRPALTCGQVPAGVDLAAAATLPTVAMTSLGALRSAAAPWNATSNVTVLITAGTGGTGYMAVQLAKALGAARVVTAATGPGLAFARSLGADVVIDYLEGSVFDAVGDGSVDVVLSNHKSNSSALRAMAKLKSGAGGGVYVTLDGDMAPSSDVPAGVRQVEYDLFHPSEAVRCVSYLDQLGAMLADGTITAHVQQTYGYEQAVEALGVEAQGHVLTKLSVMP